MPPVKPFLDRCAFWISPGNSIPNRRYDKSLAVYVVPVGADEFLNKPAEVKVGGQHIRLFPEENALGVQASVYNVNAKNWIAPSESVDDIEQGKDKAAEHARLYLRQAANLELPSLTWKQSRSV